MACSAYFIVSLLLVSSLIISPMLAVGGELAQEHSGEGGTRKVLNKSGSSSIISCCTAPTAPRRMACPCVPIPPVTPKKP